MVIKYVIFKILESLRVHFSSRSIHFCASAHIMITRPTKQAVCRSRLSVRVTLITSVPIWGSHLVSIRCKVELGLHIPHVVWLAIQIQQWRVGLIFKIDFPISVDFISGLILMALDSAFPPISDAFPPKTFKQKL